MTSPRRLSARQSWASRTIRIGITEPERDKRTNSSISPNLTLCISCGAQRRQSACVCCAASLESFLAHWPDIVIDYLGIACQQPT